MARLVKQINNLRIYQDRNGVYLVRKIDGTLLYRTVSLNDAVIRCNNCKSFLKQKVKVLVTRSSDSNIFYRKNTEIKLCHGSCDIIKEPCLDKGAFFNDYGPGFYCVPESEKELAKEWACSSYGKRNKGYVNTYKFNTSNMRILNLDKYDIIYWVTMTILFRDNNVEEYIKDALKEKYYINVDDYDCIYGWRCDDTYSTIIDKFVSEQFTAEAVKEAIKMGYLQRQFVLKSKKAFDNIEFVSAEPVVNFAEYQRRFDNRKNKADTDVLRCQRHNKNGKYIYDYIDLE